MRAFVRRLVGPRRSPRRRWPRALLALRRICVLAPAEPEGVGDWRAPEREYLAVADFARLRSHVLVVEEGARGRAAVDHVGRILVVDDRAVLARDRLVLADDVGELGVATEHEALAVGDGEHLRTRRLALCGKVVEVRVWRAARVNDLELDCLGGQPGPDGGVELVRQRSGKSGEPKHMRRVAKPHSVALLQAHGFFAELGREGAHVRVRRGTLAHFVHVGATRAVQVLQEDRIGGADESGVRARDR
mmetsp:Transcript_17032/g.40522  ORF Transcript_17032/g.40522 Transcript_17032/m.40522 type:complete len:247 (-) Transcript_17032:754-1494(-)